MVAVNQSLCREHYRLVLTLPAFPTTKPGQFIQIACRETDVAEQLNGVDALDWNPDDALPQLHGDELRGPLATLRRPFSLAGRRDTATGVELEIIHRVVGVGTDWLSHLRVGQHLNIIGPLGNGFVLPRTDQTALLVGGGVGIPPMLYLASALRGRRAIAFCGATTRDLLPLTIATTSAHPSTPAMRLTEFAEHGVSSVVTTDDGSYGQAGFVTQALEQWLEGSGFRVHSSGNASLLNPEPGSTELVEVRTPNPLIYTCGPEPMMRRVAEIAVSRGIECQIAVERAMACGMGTCQSCCIKVKKPDPSQPPLAGSDWCWRLACTDGPVFRATELLW